MILTDSAEHIVLVYDSPKTFAKAKARRLPPHVHVFCDRIGDGVTPSDFYWRLSLNVLFSHTFGVNELIAFNEVLPLSSKDVTMKFDTECAACEVSFLTGVTSLSFCYLDNSTLTLPTNVERLALITGPMGVSVSGTESLTFLSVPD